MEYECNRSGNSLSSRSDIFRTSATTAPPATLTLSGLAPTVNRGISFAGGAPGSVITSGLAPKAYVTAFVRTGYRTVIVAAEDRKFEVSAEDRTYEVSTADRKYEVDAAA